MVGSLRNFGFMSLKMIKKCCSSEIKIMLIIEDMYSSYYIWFAFALK